MSIPLASIAQETIGFVRDGRYTTAEGAVVTLAAEVERAVRGTRLLRDVELAALVAARPPRASGPTAARVRCAALRSGACAQRLLERGARKVAVLNYANGVRPGGGFLHGARAQEEALCRCSALYACLASDGVDVRAFYGENLASASALVRDHVLVSPDVPFFRDEELRLLPATFPVTVLTAAAPDLGWLRENTQDGLEPVERFAEIPALFARRTAMVLAAASAAGCDAVVVGPWGCGAFGNDPDVVADAFVAAVARFGDAFADIVFSTWGPPANRDAFERRFGRAPTDDAADDAAATTSSALHPPRR